MNINKLTIFCVITVSTFVSLHGMEPEEQTKMEIAQPFIDYLTSYRTLTDDPDNPIFAQCTAVAHHRNDTEFALGTSSGNIHIWKNCLSDPHVTTLKLFEDSIQHLAYNPQGTQLAVSSKNFIHIIRLATQKIIHTLKEETDIRALTFDRDGRIVIYSTYNFPIGKWEPKTNTKLPIKTNLFPSDFIIRSPDGKKILSKNQDKICMWKFNLNSTTQEDVTINNQSGHAAFISEEGKKIITGQADGRLFILNKLRLITPLTNPLTINKSITALAYCALIKKILITTKEDSAICILDLEHSGANTVYSNHDNETVELSVFSEEGTRLVQLINRHNKEDNSNTKLLRYTLIGLGETILPAYTIDQLQAIAKKFNE